MSAFQNFPHWETLSRFYLHFFETLLAWHLAHLPVYIFTNFKWDNYITCIARFLWYRAKPLKSLCLTHFIIGWAQIQTVFLRDLEYNESNALLQSQRRCPGFVKHAHRFYSPLIFFDTWKRQFLPKNIVQTSINIFSQKNIINSWLLRSNTARSLGSGFSLVDPTNVKACVHSKVPICLKNENKEHLLIFVFTSILPSLCLPNCMHHMFN